MTKQKVNLSIDGRGYTDDVEKDLNSKAYGLFGSGIGKQFLEYLEGISTRNIYPPGTNIETLAHAEGARWIVAVIRGRTQLGKKQHD
tara:strand:- start:2428 stop:2688 length:261 start_codon:yes stop_codon:yes gene_type:complete